jgi:hypothetical protein
MNNIATILIQQGEAAQALPMLKRAEEIKRNALGDDSVDVAGTCINLAICQEKLGDLEGALANARLVNF